MQKLILTLCVSALSLSACTETVTTSSGAFGADISVERASIVSRQNSGINAPAAGTRPGALNRGSDRFVNTDTSARSAKSQALIVPRDGEMVEVSLVNASMSSAAHAVLGDALKKTYTVSDQVSGNITIQSTGPIPKDALLELFEAALSANDARLEVDGTVVKIVPGSSGNKTFRLASDGIEPGANIIVARLEFISATQMVQLLEPLISEGLSAVADRRRNLVMLTGSAEQLEAALDAFNLFDVDVLSGKSVALVELSAADPDNIVDELKVIFENEEGGNLEGVIEFIPNKRLGSVLIITSRSRYLSRAQRWIRELDRTASGASLSIETHALQNRNASDVAAILTDLLSAGLVTATDSARSSEGGKAAATQAQVAADEARNTLIVRATRSQHREIRRLLRDIDSSPQQVLLEATIAEVTLNDDLDLGVRWFFETGNFDLTYSDADNGSAGATFPGFSAVFGTGSAAAALSALAGVTDVKVISTPTLVVLDNEEAILQIGDEVPIATQTSTDNSTNDAPTITTIEYRDTGVILRVKPNISRNGRVVLEVEQEISSVAETQTSGIDSPTISQRKIETSVLLNDGATLALGGLVQENDTKSVTKVPGLGDAPVVGSLFRRTENSKRRSELLIMIRPRVINTKDDARTVTEHWRTKLSGANSILQTGLGSPKHTVRDVLE
ncbi:type II secretion system secretin GspD [uncultured Tateyamaria sp.]|uniref:type II secretion system secretin GspD n=1 Tax=uncultured Tateyamaria sp. TaxID=455651 RepID=UPI002633D10F|nr:type II secretion system secretin GspD [uncultured Tateyamaria sp.]